MSFFKGTFSGVLACSVILLVLGIPALQAQGVGPTPISQRNVPVKITKAGSYVLTSNLTTSDPSITVISVLTGNVEIDLNGFTIQGPGREAGDSSFGINCNPAGVVNVVVRDGAVIGFGNVGVHLTSRNGKVEDVRVSDCTHGIYAGGNCVVSGCEVQNCHAGINTDDDSMVVNNNIYSCDRGISTFGGALPKGGILVTGNNCRLCSWYGIMVSGKGCRVEGNTITLCGIGIDLSDGSDNLFEKNFLQGNNTPLAGESDDIDGGTIDPALSNIIR